MPTNKFYVFLCFFYNSVRLHIYLQIQIVELLVAHGANLNSKSVLDETPLGRNRR